MAASTITRSALTNGTTPWSASTINSAVYDKIDELFGGAGTYATFELGGALKINGALTQLSNDGGALGTSSLGWSDLFLASGGVINWNNGDVTLTHSTNTLTFGGAASGYIFNDGNVGIGVTPTGSLHVERAGVNNIISAIGQTGYEGVLYLSGAGSGKDTAVVVGNDRSFYVRTTSTATPTASGTARLGIHGSGNAAIGSTAKFYLDGVAGTGDTYLHESSANRLAFVVGGTERFAVAAAGVESYGTVGIGYFANGSGTSTGTAVVRNSGDAYLYLQSSSRRFKENIAPAVVTDAQLDAFMAATPSWWDYKGQKNGALGFIAEDLAALPLDRYGVNPLVNYDGDGQIESNRDYALIAMHHLVIQRMQKEIDALKARIH